MSTVKEMTDYVVGITKRYDKVDFLASRVKTAIRRCHAIKDFPQDLYEELIDPTTLTGADMVGIAPLPAGFRKLEILRATDATGNKYKNQEFKIHSPRKLLELEGKDKIRDTAYIVNNNVSFNCSRPVTKIYCAYYKIPALSDDEDETWLMEAFPEACQDLALALFYAQTSATEVANSYMRTYEMVHRPTIEDSYVEAQRGYV